MCGCSHPHNSIRMRLLWEHLYASCTPCSQSKVRRMRLASCWETPHWIMHHSMVCSCQGTIKSLGNSILQWLNNALQGKLIGFHTLNCHMLSIVSKVCKVSTAWETYYVTRIETLIFNFRWKAIFRWKWFLGSCDCHQHPYRKKQQLLSAMNPGV